MAATDQVERLRAAGVPVDRLSEAQRKVLSELSQEELETLIKFQERLGSDVQGYLKAPSDDFGVIIY